MSKRGPKPRPIEELHASGSRRVRERVEPGPRPAPRAGRQLAGQARKLFNDLAKRLARRGAIDAIDTGLLERYCRMRLLTSAQLKLAEAGDQAARKFVLRANSQLLAMERELGLTPASRGEVRPQPPKQVEDEKAQRYGLIG